MLVNKDRDDHKDTMAKEQWMRKQLPQCIMKYWTITMAEETKDMIL